MTNYDILKEYETHKTPVPSYEEWRNLQSSWVDEIDKATRFKKALDDVCEEYNSKLPILEEENKQLKELLNECRDVIEWYKADCGYKDLPTESVLTKIDQELKKK